MYAEERFRGEGQTRKEMELLQALEERIHIQGEAATRRAENDKVVRVPKLTGKDDIVSYLTMFEWLVMAYEVKREAAHFVGKALEAYAALSMEDSRDYEKVKEVIFRKFDIGSIQGCKERRTGI